MVDDYTKKWLQKAMNDLKVVKNERVVEKENLVTDAICFLKLTEEQVYTTIFTTKGIVVR